MKSRLGTYNFTDVSEMKNMIRMGSASYLVLLIKYWKGLLLESASEKAMVYVDDNTFCDYRNEKVREVCGEKKDGEGVLCGTDCDKGVAQSLTALVLTSCVSSLKPYCLFVRYKYYSSQYLRFLKGYNKPMVHYSKTKLTRLFRNYITR